MPFSALFGLHLHTSQRHCSDGNLHDKNNCRESKRDIRCRRRHVCLSCRDPIIYAYVNMRDRNGFVVDVEVFPPFSPMLFLIVFLFFFSPCVQYLYVWWSDMDVACIMYVLGPATSRHHVALAGQAFWVCFYDFFWKWFISIQHEHYFSERD